MTKIADMDTADRARATHDALVFLRGSVLGHRLDALMAKIESDAITRAMHGKTPQDTNTYYETRGRLAVTREIKDLFDDIEKDNVEALGYMADFNAKQKGKE